MNRRGWKKAEEALAKHKAWHLFVAGIDGEWAEAEVVSNYTPVQAIEDGVLVNLMQNEFEEACRQHFKYPITCTIAVFEIMQRAVENPRYCNDYAGMLKTCFG